MNTLIELLANLQQMDKRYERACTEVRARYALSQLEVEILGYLRNNPELDTASDIVKYRMISKANVSQGVEQLMQRGYLSRRQDGQDRRKIHLQLRPEADGVVEAILAVQQRFWDRMLRGISREEWLQYQDVSQRIFDNLNQEWSDNEWKTTTTF